MAEVAHHVFAVIEFQTGTVATIPMHGYKEEADAQKAAEGMGRDLGFLVSSRLLMSTPQGPMPSDKTGHSIMAMLGVKSVSYVVLHVPLRDGSNIIVPEKKLILS